MSDITLTMDELLELIVTAYVEGFDTAKGILEGLSDTISAKAIEKFRERLGALA